MGEKVRNDFHKKPEERGKDEKVAMPFPAWLLDHDAEAHATSVYEQVSRDIIQNGYRRPGEFFDSESSIDSSPSALEQSA